MVRIATSLASLAILAASVPSALGSFLEGCANAPWDSATDFWNVKFTDKDLPFAAEYNNTFVKIRNRQSRYVVLHCTNEPPPSEAINSGERESLVVKVPVESVAALDGFTQELIDVSNFVWGFTPIRVSSSEIDTRV
jgi:hypothetical protein